MNPRWILGALLLSLAWPLSAADIWPQAALDAATEAGLAPAVIDALIAGDIPEGLKVRNAFTTGREAPLVLTGAPTVTEVQPAADHIAASRLLLAALWQHARESKAVVSPQHIRAIASSYDRDRALTHFLLLKESQALVAPTEPQTLAQRLQFWSGPHRVSWINDDVFHELVTIIGDDRPSVYVDTARVHTVGDRALAALAQLLRFDPRDLASMPVDAPWTAEQRTLAAKRLAFWARENSREAPAALRLRTLPEAPVDTWPDYLAQAGAQQDLTRGFLSVMVKTSPGVMATASATTATLLLSVSSPDEILGQALAETQMGSHWPEQVAWLQGAGHFDQARVLLNPHLRSEVVRDQAAALALALADPVVPRKPWAHRLAEPVASRGFRALLVLIGTEVPSIWTTFGYEWSMQGDNTMLYVLSALLGDERLVSESMVQWLQHEGVAVQQGETVRMVVARLLKNSAIPVEGPLVALVENALGSPAVDPAAPMPKTDGDVTTSRESQTADTREPTP